MKSQLIDIEFLKSNPLPQYNAEANKAVYGKLLVVAGSRSLPGAAILVARAALRAGCGTVRAALPESVALAVGVAVPELMMLPLPETAAGSISFDAFKRLEKQFEACDAVVLGPGLEEGMEVERLSREMIEKCPLPMVVDAQALAAFDKDAQHPAPRVLTPHLRELSEITGQSTESLEKNRERAADCFKDPNVTLVWKGRETLIAGDGVLLRNEAGTRGLGTAGSGDVLSGLLGSFLAQDVAPHIAAAWAVHIHALAGEAAEKDLGDDGMMASDIAARAPGVLRYLRKQTQPAKEDKSRAGLRVGLRKTEG